MSIASSNRISLRDECVSSIIKFTIEKGELKFKMTSDEIDEVFSSRSLPPSISMYCSVSAESLLAPVNEIDPKNNKFTSISCDGYERTSLEDCSCWNHEIHSAMYLDDFSGISSHLERELLVTLRNLYWRNYSETGDYTFDADEITILQSISQRPDGLYKCFYNDKFLSDAIWSFWQSDRDESDRFCDECAQKLGGVLSLKKIDRIEEKACEYTTVTSRSSYCSLCNRKRLYSFNAHHFKVGEYFHFADNVQHLDDCVYDDILLF